MPYATRDDVVAAIGENLLRELEDRNGDNVSDPGEQDVTTRALAEASSLADGKLSRRGYAVPLATTPDILRHHVVYIAVYYLAPEADVLSKLILRRYEDALKWLEAVAEGKIDLGLPTTSAPPVTRRVVSVASDPRLFSRKQTRGLF